MSSDTESRREVERFYPWVIVIVEGDDKLFLRSPNVSILNKKTLKKNLYLDDITLPTKFVVCSVDFLLFHCHG